MTVRFWVKFEGHEPQLYDLPHFAALSELIRERIMRFGLILEWVIRE